MKKGKGKTVATGGKPKGNRPVSGGASTIRHGLPKGKNPYSKR
jgi:hypothetical protein